MAFRNAKWAVAGVLALAGCAHPVSLTQASASCDRGAAHAEVQSSGRVERVLGIRTTRSGAHEGFIVRVHDRPIRVETNVDITGVIPLRTGDRVTLRGQYECDDGVIHWTHHDPSGRHTWGYIEVHGRRYQ